jgi:hypothetical protein
MATARTTRPICRKLLAKITRPEAPPNLGMVAGNRLKRQDNWSKRAASRIANSIRRAALKDGADDSGSGVKVFKRDAFLRLPYFDHMHRFMAALMLREGYAVEFLEVNHRQRSAGRSKYTNLGRLAANMTDLWGVMWLRSRARLAGGSRRDMSMIASIQANDWHYKRRRRGGVGLARNSRGVPWGPFSTSFR